MRKFKKTLSAALAAIMAVSSVAVGTTAFAADTKDGSTVQKALTYSNQTVVNTSDEVKDVYYLFKPAKSADYTFSISSSKSTVEAEDIEAQDKYDGLTNLEANVFNKTQASIKIGVYDGVRYYWAQDKDGNYYMNFAERTVKTSETSEVQSLIQNEVFLDGEFQQVVHTANEGDVVVDKYDNGVNNVHYNLKGMGTSTFDKSYTYLIQLQVPAKSYATINCVENTGYSYSYNKTVEYVTLLKADGTFKKNQKIYTGVGATITGYHGSSINLTMPTSIDGYNVTGVDLYGMSESKRIRIVAMTIPSTVTSIEDCYEMYSLKKVNMPASLTGVGYEAFKNCMNLKTRVDLGKKVVYIGDRAFDGTNIAGVSVANDNATNTEPTTAGSTVNTIESSSRVFGYTHAMNTTTQYKKYDDQPDAEIKGFFVVANADSSAAKYAKAEGFALYNAADCTAGKHQYALTKTVAATIWAAGSKTYTCKVCDATKVETIAKKTLKATVKGGKKKFTVKCSANADQTGYQIKFTKNGKSKSVKVKNARALNTTVKGLKAGKYSVKVRAYKKTSNGTKYSSYTAAKKVTVK